MDIHFQGLIVVSCVVPHILLLVVLPWAPFLIITGNLSQLLQESSPLHTSAIIGNNDTVCSTE